MQDGREICRYLFPCWLRRGRVDEYTCTLQCTPFALPYTASTLTTREALSTHLLLSQQGQRYRPISYTLLHFSFWRFHNRPRYGPYDTVVVASLSVDSATTALRNGASTYRCISKQMHCKTPFSHKDCMKSLEFYSSWSGALAAGPNM